DAGRLLGFEPMRAEAQADGARRRPLDSALMGFAVFRAFRLQHDGSIRGSSLRLGGLAATRRASTLLCLKSPVLLRHGIVGHDLALEDPHRDADDARGGAPERRAVVDVGAERMQRHAALAVPLHARNFRAAEPAAAIDAYAERAHADGRLHGALHGAAE